MLLNRVTTDRISQRDFEMCDKFISIKQKFGFSFMGRKIKFITKNITLNTWRMLSVIVIGRCWNFHEDIKNTVLCYQQNPWLRQYNEVLAEPRVLNSCVECKCIVESGYLNCSYSKYKNIRKLQNQFCHLSWKRFKFITVTMDNNHLKVNKEQLEYFNL